MRICEFANNQTDIKYLELEGHLCWSVKYDKIGLIHSVDIDCDRFPILDVFWADGRQTLSAFIHLMTNELIDL